MVSRGWWRGIVAIKNGAYLGRCDALLQSVEHHRDANLHETCERIAGGANGFELRTSDVKTSWTCDFVSWLGPVVENWVAAPFSGAADVGSPEAMTVGIGEAVEYVVGCNMDGCVVYARCVRTRLSKPKFVFSRRIGVGYQGWCDQSDDVAEAGMQRRTLVSWWMLSAVLC